MPKETSPPEELKGLYPQLNAAQLEKAQDNLDRYLGLVLRIHERLSPEQDLSDSPTSFDEEEALG